ncbi:MAG: fimbria/pilus periplasmic chaperone [Endozoicomonadaceae bacterium]|nr:fimbria/pilus periplasmic chaperone [Endozoicomonadaceae bacterium]
MRNIIFTLLAVLISTTATTLNASMLLDKVIVYFDPGQAPRQDIIIRNPDPETLYLQTEVYNVVNPGRENEERVRITDPDKLKLLATPRKAVIPANGRKTIRLVSLEAPSKTEEVYRVTFRPVIGDIHVTQTAIKLLIAYQTLVFIRPVHPAYDVTADWKGKKIVFSNKGNINAVLRNGQFCTSKKDESCTPMEESTRLYAGQSWELELPDSKGYVRYGLFDGEFEKLKTFQPNVK